MIEAKKLVNTLSFNQDKRFLATFFRCTYVWFYHPPAP